MKHTQQRSSLFLLELIINLFLFVICAAVCVGILLYARGLSTESRDLTNAVYMAQSAAEEWKATGTQPAWRTPEENGLSGGFENNGDTLDISIYKQGKLIYSLEGVSRNE